MSFTMLISVIPRPTFAQIAPSALIPSAAAVGALALSIRQQRPQPRPSLPA
jgi:hypothetical protein